MGLDYITRNWSLWKKFRSSMQHSLNAMHICCRLREMGLPLATAKRYATIYEKFSHRLLYA